jgi:flagellar basal-body rod protein FlgF
MDVGAQVSASLNALTREFDIIAHNLANASTAGYKRRMHGFSQAMDTQTSASEGTADGEAASGEGFDFSQGHLIETGRTFDVALYGKGFFMIETPEGPLYTRHGIFRTNQNGQVVDSEGRAVAGANGPLAIPAGANLTEVTVSQNGEISADGEVVGQFRVVDFGDDEDRLIAMGLGCYQAPKDAKGEDAEEVVVRQGCQEASNVEMVDELVSMIMVTRTYEANVKLVNVKKDTTSSVIGIAMG